MLRVSTAVLLAVLAFPQATQASTGAPRVALAPIEDTLGLDPRALADMGVGLRGVALEEDVDVVDLTLDAGAPCDLRCLGELADQLGADYLINGRSGRSAGRLVVSFDLHPITRGEVGDPLETAVASGTDTGALVVDAERAGRALLSLIRASTRRPARTAIRRPVRVDDRRGYAYRTGPQWDERSPGLALALELLFPGAGLGYAGDWGSVGLQYLGIFTGFILIISSIETVDDGGGNVDGMGLTMGLVLVVGARVYGIARAPAAADIYNHESRRAWEAGRAAELRRLRLEAPEIGLASPRYTALSLPPLTF